MFIPQNAESFFKQFHKINKREVVLSRPPLLTVASLKHCLSFSLLFRFRAKLPETGKTPCSLNQEWHVVQEKQPVYSAPKLFPHPPEVYTLIFHNIEKHFAGNGPLPPVSIGILSLSAAVFLLGVGKGGRKEGVRQGGREVQMMLSLKSEKHNQKRQSEKQAGGSPAATRCCSYRVPQAGAGETAIKHSDGTAALPLRTKQGTGWAEHRLGHTVI